MVKVATGFAEGGAMAVCPHAAELKTQKMLSLESKRMERSAFVEKMVGTE
jgi:hypothetical protein